MNERIQELMEQASSNACYDEPNQLHLMNDEIEKFAELIVRECVRKCEFVGNIVTCTTTGEMARKTKATADSCATLIREHFGIEE